MREGGCMCVLFKKITPQIGYNAALQILVYNDEGVVVEVFEQHGESFRFLTKNALIYFALYRFISSLALDYIMFDLWDNLENLNKLMEKIKC